MSSVIAASWLFYLYDVCAEITEEHGRKWSGENTRKVENSYVRQGKHRHRIRDNFMLDNTRTVRVFTGE